MHSSTYEGDDYVGDRWQVTFLHNGDYSGDVKITDVRFRTSAGVPLSPAEAGDVEIEIPFEAIEEFVLDKLRAEKISRLELATYDELKNELFV
jgi:hypothetical protein